MNYLNQSSYLKKPVLVRIVRFLSVWGVGIRMKKKRRMETRKKDKFIDFFAGLGLSHHTPEKKTVIHHNLVEHHFVAVVH